MVYDLQLDELIFPLLILTGYTLLVYWFDYVLGHPMAAADRVNVHAIGFHLSFRVARRRLVREGLWRTIVDDYLEAKRMTSAGRLRRRLDLDHRRDVVLEAQPYLRWERALLCPVCLHWWLSLGFLVTATVASLVPVTAVPVVVVYYLLNHLIIRKLV